jgi:hypothetical protein
VSATQELSTSVDELREVRAPRLLPWTGWTLRSRLTAAAVLLLLAGGAVTVAVTHGDDAPAATGPVTLPEQVLGNGPVDEKLDPTRVPGWQDKAKAAAPGAFLTARTYGPEKGSLTIRAVTARTDLTGKLEQAWAADEGTEAGDGRCTQNVQFTPGGKAGVRSTLVLCWHTTPTLSAYVLLIDPKAPVAVETGRKALDEVWTAAGGR